MIRQTTAVVAFALLLFPLAAQAAEQTAVLDVHHAGCVLCGPIVKSTLEHVKGVRKVRVSQANGDADVTAIVTFDDTQTATAKLIKATTDRGYPARLAKSIGKS